MAAAMPMPTSQSPSRTCPGLGLRLDQPNRLAPSVMHSTSIRSECGWPVSGWTSGSLRMRSSMGSRPSCSASWSMAHSRLIIPGASPGARMALATAMSSFCRLWPVSRLGAA